MIFTNYPYNFSTPLPLPDGVATLKSNIDDGVDRRRLFETVIFFAHYAIVIPAFLLCWFALIRWLRRLGVISQLHGEQLETVPVTLFHHSAGISAPHVPHSVKIAR